MKKSSLVEIRTCCVTLSSVLVLKSTASSVSSSPLKNISPSWYPKIESKMSLDVCLGAASCLSFARTLLRLFITVNCKSVVLSQGVVCKESLISRWHKGSGLPAAIAQQPAKCARGVFLLVEQSADWKIDKAPKVPMIHDAFSILHRSQVVDRVVKWSVS